MQHTLAYYKSCGAAEKQIKLMALRMGGSIQPAHSLLGGDIKRQALLSKISYLLAAAHVRRFAHVHLQCLHVHAVLGFREREPSRLHREGTVTTLRGTPFRK